MTAHVSAFNAINGTTVGITLHATYCSSTNGTTDCSAVVPTNDAAIGSAFQPAIGASLHATIFTTHNTTERPVIISTNYAAIVSAY